MKKNGKLQMLIARNFDDDISLEYIIKTRKLNPNAIPHKMRLVIIAEYSFGKIIINIPPIVVSIELKNYKKRLN